MRRAASDARQDDRLAIGPVLSFVHQNLSEECLERIGYGQTRQGLDITCPSASDHTTQQ